MNVITDLLEARAFLKNMGKSLEDLSYWKDWYLLDVTAPAPLDWIRQAKISTLLRTKLPDNDGSILWLDGSLMVVFQNPNAPELEEFKDAVAKALAPQTPTYALFAVATQAADVQALLAHRQGQAVAPPQPVASYRLLKSLVPNIEDLLRNWHAEQKTREGRAKPLIMVVDDDPLVLKMASRALGSDYDILTAQNGSEAIAKHLQHMPDIIFLDIGLPDCDGLTLLNYMQQYDQTSRIVMFSADDFLKTRVKAFAGGAKAFLPKPFNLKAFQNQIAAWLSGGADKI